MAAPIAKAATRVETVEELPRILTEAFALAVAGRPGPVLVDIPLDLQLAEVEAPLPDAPAAIDAPEEEPLHADAISRVVADLASAERPLILAGGGLRAGRAVAGFRQLVDRLGVPVVSSLMGVDALPFDHPLRVGMIGTYGNRWANIALSRCDALLVLGSRLDIRQTGADTEAFTAGRTIHHIDVDPGEMNNRIAGCEALIAPLARAILGSDRGGGGLPRRDACGLVRGDRRAGPAVAGHGGAAGDRGDQPQPADAPGLESSAAAAYVADVGQHQMWAAQSLELGEQQRFLTSGGMGAMGFGPAARGRRRGGQRRPGRDDRRRRRLPDSTSRSCRRSRATSCR